MMIKSGQVLFSYTVSNVLSSMHVPILYSIGLGLSVDPLSLFPAEGGVEQ
jgi:hypothetical protein